MSKEQKAIRIPEGYKAVSFDNDSGEILLEKSPVCITQRVKTLKDVLDYHEYHEDAIDEIHESMVLKGFEHLYFQWLAELIVSALNEGWEPDLDDYNERKWCVKYLAEEGCLRAIDRSYYIFTPIRLLFKNEKIACHVLNTPEFLDIFKKFMIIEKD